MAGANKKNEELLKYYAYIDSLDFSQLKTRQISFDKFKSGNTKILMGRLQHYYEPVFSPAKDIDTESFDVLLLNTAHGKLVVMYIIPEEFKSLALYGCTLTSLKRKGYLHLFFGGTTKELPEKKTTPLGQFHCWERPYELRAHTEADEDYGDIWNGDKLVRAGNKYGDTSKFLIIGYIS